MSLHERDDRELLAEAARIESLVEKIDSYPDPELRASATGVVSGLLALYGEALARVLKIIREEPAASDHLLERLTADSLVSHLLLLHDLHPVDVETRVRQALADLSAYLRTRGGRTELVSIEDGVAELRLYGAGSGCSSSFAALKQTVEEAVQAAGPELEEIRVELLPEPTASAFVPASALLG